MSPLPSSAGRAPYEVVRSRRRSFSLQVKEDGRVVVRAPLRASRRDVEAFVGAHDEWLRGRLDEVRRRHAELASRDFADGTPVPFRGGELILRLGSSATAVGARPGDHPTELHLPGVADTADRATRRRAVIRWLLDVAPGLVDTAHRAAAERVGLSADRITLKDMRSRWGSCGPNRRMSLCWRLVLAPPPILDYVLVHELCHIEIANHSAAFWRRVEGACPEWRRHRRWLRENGRSLVL